MSDEEGESRKRTRRGQSDGGYKAKKAHGLTNQFQASWYDPPNCPLRKHWLKDGGLAENKEYLAQCTVCNTSFQSRAVCVKAHEQGKKHKERLAAWQQAQKDRAVWQQRLDKGEELTAQRRAGHAADLKLHTLFASTYKHLQLGRPITDVSAERPFLEFIKAPHIPTMHWHKDSVWRIVEALDSTLLKHSQQLIRSSSFFTISLDEASAIGKVSFLCVHVHILRDWVRVPIFLELSEVTDSPTAANVLAMVRDTLLTVSGLPLEQLHRRLVGAATDGANVMTGVHTGLCISLRRSMAPFIVPVHCAAHRLNHAAAVLKDQPLISKLSGVLDSLNRQFCKSSTRTNHLRALAAEAKLPSLVPLRVVPTRWLSLVAPLERLARCWKPFLLYCLEAEGTEALAGHLTDYQLLFTTHALLPMLRDLLAFCKLCQLEHIQLYELMQQLNSIKQRIREMYLGVDSYNAFSFPILQQLRSIPSKELQEQQQEEQQQQPGAQQHGLFWSSKGELCIRVGSTEVEMQGLPPPDAATRRPAVRLVPITEELKPRVEQQVMEKLAAAAEDMLNDVSARFPSSELAWAMGCIYPAWWQQAPDGKGKKQLDQALAILNDAFCKSRPLVENAAAAGSNSEVAAPLSFESLQDQKGVFAAEMQAFVESHAPSAAAAREQAVSTRQAEAPPSAPERPATLAPSQAASTLEQAVPMSDRALRAARRAAQAAQAAADANPEAPSSDSESDEAEPESEPDQEVQEAAAKPLPKAEAFWQEACRLGANLRYPEFVKLAQLVMVMVPGSVEDERMFSAMKYLKNPQRNSLKEQHLTACARAFKSKEFSIASFPYPAAIGKWLDASKRGRYGLK